MSYRSIGLLLLLSVMCILLGILLVLERFTGGASVSIETLLAQGYSGSRQLQSLGALASALPEHVVYYARLVDRSLVFYAAITALAIFMAALSLRRAAAISRDEGVTYSLQGFLSSFTRRAQNRARLFARIPFLTKAWNLSLPWRIERAIVGFIFLVGLLATGTLYPFAGDALRNQVDQRTLVMARNLSHAAGVQMQQGNYLALHALVAKYALPDDVAYTLVEDHRGRVLAHSMRVLPPEVAGSLSGDDATGMSRRALSLRGEQVYDAVMPIFEGPSGAVRVGIWKSAVEKEIRRELLLLIVSILAIVSAGAVISVLLARSIIRPLQQVSQLAEEMSKGNLDTPISVKAKGEVEELALSLEGIRVILKESILRLEQEWSRRQALNEHLEGSSPNAAGKYGPVRQSRRGLGPT
ncbi:MAG: HAMP domain-containing protein [Candidatus Binatia bacterium]